MLLRRAFLAGTLGVSAASLLRSASAFAAKGAPVVTKGEPGWTRYFTTSMVVSVPDAVKDAVRAGSPVDWVLHFHGAPENLERNLGAVGINAVVAVVNRGTSSDAYGRLNTPLPEYEDASRKMIGALAVKRTVLIGWSAGAAAVHRLMGDESDQRRIDAIILADGLYSRYRGMNNHSIDRAPLEDYAKLAKLAKAKTKFFGLSHGTIVEVGHPTVRESIDELLAMVGDTPKPWGASPPSYALRPYRELHAGDFHVLGYKGDTRDAHISQLRHMSKTLLPLLAARFK